MEDIINHLKNLTIRNNSNMNVNNSPNINNNNMNNNNNVERQRNFIMQNLKMVHPFGGHRDGLSTYIRSIVSVIPNIATMMRDDRVLFFNSILRTLQDEALDVVRRERPTDWSSLKTILPQLILSIDKIKFKSSCKFLCDEITKWICRINDAVELCGETEVNFCSLNVLKRELPIHLVALLNANLVTDFRSGVKILRENSEIENNAHTYFKPNNHRNLYRYNVRPQIINNEFRNLVTPKRRFPIPLRNPQNNIQPHFPNPQNNIQPRFQYAQNNFQAHPMNESHNPFQNYQNKFQNHNRSYQNHFQNLNYQGNNPNHKRMREHDSTQSRLRRFGAPVPMEVENFHSIASNHSPPS